MSVVADQISRKFGSQWAVKDLSFKAEKGRILGFLGPNGAGKSTSLKMIAGYLPPTHGRISVAGIDVGSAPILAKAQLGYLPEHNPLYLHMYVREFLSFMAGISSPNLNVNEEVERVIERAGLQREAHKMIQALSKGYRQRVGIAQALIHDPEVIILDEPTSGLDPNQIQEIRALIRELGQSKTLIFSSHIMQEVSALCQDVLILDQGQVKFQGSLKELADQGPLEEMFARLTQKGGKA